MTNLTSIVKATRASASAVKAMQITRRRAEDAEPDSLQYIQAREDYDRAERRFTKAQAVLRANPLPGDR